MVKVFAGTALAVVIASLALTTYVAVMAQDKETQCTNNLGQLSRLLEIYRKNFGGNNYELPLELGEKFWLKLTETGVIETANPKNPTDASILQCPLEGNKNTVPDYRGPRLNVNVPSNYLTKDPIGGDKTGNHGDPAKNGINMLTKGNQVRKILPTDTEWQTFLEKTISRAYELSYGTVQIFKGETGSLTLKVGGTEKFGDGTCQVLTISSDKELYREWFILTVDGWRVCRRWVAGKEITDEPSDDEKKAIAKLLNDLDSDDTQTRDKAYAGLINKYAKAKSLIEKCFKETTDPNTSRLLQMLIHDGSATFGLLKFKFPIKDGDAYGNDDWRVKVAGSETIGKVSCFKLECASPQGKQVYWLNEIEGILQMELEGKRYTRQ